MGWRFWKVEKNECASFVSAFSREFDCQWFMRWESESRVVILCSWSRTELAGLGYQNDEFVTG